MEKEQVQQIVLETIKDFCNQNGIDIQGEISLNQRLIGSSGLFDSMDLVNFLVDLEEVLEEEYDQEFILQDERAMSRSHSPFMNPEELTKFILEINEQE
ncbi:hypothetical protein EGH90_10905 [Kaistella haifensis]|jgi:acyl carrier protein|nr:hypothetical protein EGH90_10905 [Kaistella haifensis]